MRILVTGAGGFIGRHLVSSVSNGHEIVCVVREPSSISERARETAVVMDLARPLDAKVLPARIDTVVHLAQGRGTFPDGADELFAVNTAAVEQLLQYGRRAGARHFILASTGDVYGPRIGLSREIDPVRPASYYAATKSAAELLVEAYSADIRPCVLRLFQPYGPGQVGRLIPRLAACVREKRPVRLHRNDRPRLTPVHVDDVIRLLEAVIAAGHSGRINVAGDRMVSVRELAEEIGRVVGMPPVFEETGEESMDLAGENALMRQLLDGRALVPLVEGLSRTLGGSGASPCTIHT